MVCYIFLKPVENSKRSNNNDNSLKLRQHLTVIKGYHLLPPWVFVTHYKIGMYKVTGQWGKQASSSASQTGAVFSLSTYYVTGPTISTLLEVLLFFLFDR